MQLRNMKKYPEALEYFNNITTFHPQFIGGHVERMYTLFEIASWDQVLESAQKVMLLFPDCHDALFIILIHDLIKEGPTNASLEYLEKLDDVKLILIMLVIG
jgi:tetratricopeptide (TPR) repeat protein